MKILKTIGNVLLSLIMYVFFVADRLLTCVTTKQQISWKKWCMDPKANKQVPMWMDKTGEITVYPMRQSISRVIVVTLLEILIYNWIW
jgi:hypothetical protein